MIDILIENGIIVTMDRNRTIIDGGSIAIQDDRIVDIGPAEIGQECRARQVIDAANMLVLPGLINCHVHAGGSLARGLGDDLSLMEAHDKLYAPLIHGPELHPNDVYIGTLLSCIEFIRSGQTCIADHYIQEAEVAKALIKAGIKGVLSPLTFDTWPSGGKPSFLKERHDVIAEAVRFIEEWNGKGGGRIKAWFGPTHELFASKELLLEIVSLAEKLKVGIHMLLAETPWQVNSIKRQYGKRSIEYVFDLGVLRPGTVAGHCCWLSDREVGLLARSGASVATTPVCEMKIADGITPVPRLLEAGVNVTIGTDLAMQCNGTNDIIREMKTLALLHKVNYPLDPEVITAEAVLEMVTVNAAKALLWESEIGSLEKGKKADLIMVDLKQAHLTPVLRKPKLNVVSLMVYSASGGDVDTMIVDGKVVMLHQKILTFNEADVIEEAQHCAESLLDRTGIAAQSWDWKWRTGEDR